MVAADDDDQTKTIELYAAMDIADLSQYAIGVDSGPKYTFPVASVNASTFIYVTSSSSGFQSFFGSTADYETSIVFAADGKAAVELSSNGVAVDVFADANNFDNDWRYTKGWVYRKKNTGPDVPFAEGSWVFSGRNVIRNKDSNAEAGTARFPMGSFVAVCGMQHRRMQWLHTLCYREWEGGGRVLLNNSASPVGGGGGGSNHPFPRIRISLREKMKLYTRKY